MFPGGGDVRHSGRNYLQTRVRQELPGKGAPFSLTPDTTDAFVYQGEFVNWVNVCFPNGASSVTAGMAASPAKRLRCCWS